jgi:transposase-like protein
MPKVTLITGAERRRRWNADEREQILAAVNAPGAVVAEVGRRWDVWDYQDFRVWPEWLNIFRPLPA